MFTPDKLREMAENNKFDRDQIDEGCPDIVADLLACAEAWERDRTLLNRRADAGWWDDHNRIMKRQPD